MTLSSDYSFPTCDDFLGGTKCEAIFASTPPRMCTQQPLAGWSASPSQCRKRATLSCLSLQEESVSALLPKMKRIRLRPSLGQLRLQREAHDANDFGPEVQFSVDPEHLRAVAVIAAFSGAGGGSSGSSRSAARQTPGHTCNEFLHVELSFPPQYPHRPPRVFQVSPAQCLPCLQYDAGHIVLPRLTERCWSSAMGVIDIVQDLLQALGHPFRPSLSPCSLSAPFPPASTIVSHSVCRDLQASSVLLEDVEMG